MTTRTEQVQRIGNSSGVLLPKEWLRTKGIKPGDPVRIEFTETRVVILPAGKDRDVRVTARFARVCTGIGTFSSD
jgi:antitoxin component of MazEF toxin-antitoxin module